MPVRRSKYSLLLLLSAPKLIHCAIAHDTQPDMNSAGTQKTNSLIGCDDEKAVRGNMLTKT